MQEKYFDINIPGYSIKCKLYCNTPGGIENLVVFGHGFGGHKDTRAAERFARKALAKCSSAAVLTFDWPSHGHDVRKLLVLEECDTYLDHVLMAAKERYHPKALYGYATSFGGYLFLKHLSEKGNPFEKLALRCPAVHMYDVLMKFPISSEEMARLKKGKPIEVGFDRKIHINQTFLEALQENDLSTRDFIPFAEDILILHGTKDEIVPFADIADFADENIIEFVPVENADHRFTDINCMNKAIATILTFFGW